MPRSESNSQAWTEAQFDTYCALVRRYGAADYVNDFKPSTAVYADWLTAEVMARITPSGEWENVHDAVVG